MKNVITLAAAVALAGSTAAVQAYEAGDWILQEPTFPWVSTGP